MTPIAFVSECSLMGEMELVFQLKVEDFYIRVSAASIWTVDMNDG